jgi:hypothetical protein
MTIYSADTLRGPHAMRHAAANLFAVSLQSWAAAINLRRIRQAHQAKQ